jgi:hypothetical protein
MFQLAKRKTAPTIDFSRFKSMRYLYGPSNVEAFRTPTLFAESELDRPIIPQRLQRLAWKLSNPHLFPFLGPHLSLVKLWYFPRYRAAEVEDLVCLMHIAHHIAQSQLDPFPVLQLLFAAA